MCNSCYCTKLNNYFVLYISSRALGILKSNLLIFSKFFTLSETLVYSYGYQLQKEGPFISFCNRNHNFLWNCIIETFHSSTQDVSDILKHSNLAMVAFSGSRMKFPMKVYSDRVESCAFEYIEIPIRKLGH